MFLTTTFFKEGYVSTEIKLQSEGFIPPLFQNRDKKSDMIFIDHFQLQLVN